jgi:hypothetical protein
VALHGAPQFPLANFEGLGNHLIHPKSTTCRFRTQR